MGDPIALKQRSLFGRGKEGDYLFALACYLKGRPRMSEDQGKRSGSEKRQGVYRIECKCL